MSRLTGSDESASMVSGLAASQATAARTSMFASPSEDSLIGGDRLSLWPARQVLERH